MIHCLHLELVLNARALTHVPLFPSPALGNLHFTPSCCCCLLIILSRRQRPQPYLDTGAGKVAGTGAGADSLGHKTKQKQQKKERRLWKLLRYPEDMFSNFF